jgi:CubicO group peptidase (beta-lactamase class C family)
MAVLIAIPGVPALIIWLFGPSVVGPMPDLAAQPDVLDAYFDDLVDEGYPPGLVVNVMQGGETRFSKAYGYATGDGEAMTVDTTLRWWSVTKLVTAVAVLRLIDHGQLSLDESAAKFLPFLDLHTADGQARRVTILHLLNHTSGVQDNMPEGMRALRFPDESVVDQFQYADQLMASRQTLEFEPGTHASYTNTAYILLGAIVQKISGLSYEEYVHRNILTPLRMTSTDFVFPPQRPGARGSHPILHFVTPLLALLGDEASGAFDTARGGLIWFNEFYLDYTASTSLNGPLCDLARFNQMILNGGELDGARVLSEPATQMFLHAHFERLQGAPAWTMQGIGWRRPPLDIEQPRYKLLHSGGGPGFSTHNVIFPDENLSYSFAANGTDLPREAISRLLDRIEWHAQQPMENGCTSTASLMNAAK